MSYEGYDQILCKNGHESSIHAYDPLLDIDNWSCPICKEKVAWWNSVDLTNGSFENGQRIDGYVKLEVDRPEENCICPDCGVSHVKRVVTHKIPNNVGHKI